MSAAAANATSAGTAAACVTVIGPLLADAQLTFTPDATPTAVLSLEIDAAKGMPYRVRHVLGTDPTVHMLAHQQACAMRRGAVVQAIGAGLRAQSDHGLAALVLLSPTDVTLVQPAPAKTPTPTGALVQKEH